MMITFYVFKSIETDEIVAINPQTYDLTVKNHKYNLNSGGQTEKKAQAWLEVLREAKAIRAKTTSEAIELF